MHTTLAAVAIVGVVFVVAGVALVTLLRDSLTDSVRDAATLRANDVAGALRTAGSADALDLPADEDVLVQVVDGSGKVSAASPNVAGDSPMAAIPAGSSARVDDVPVRDDDEVEGEDLLVVARRAPAGAGGDGGGDAGGLILVGRTLESVDESVTLTMRSLLVGIPVLLVVVGLVTWLIVGRALAPVERARAEVAEISDRDLHRRVPEPPTNDEIGRLARTLNAMLARLEDAKARQRRFVSDSSHELRSPVASIRHHAEVALAHPEGTSVTELARDVLAEDLRLEQLVDDLTWIARADEHAPATPRAAVDLDDLVLDEARRRARHRHAACRHRGGVGRQGERRRGTAPPAHAQPARQRGASRRAAR